MQVILFIMLLFSTTVYANEVKKIAITIDDVPAPSTSLFKGLERTKKIIKDLQESHASRVGLFVIGENLREEKARKRLKLYDAAGYMVGNHTYSHKSCRAASAEDFIADINKAHEVISSYDNFKPFFRYPYLNECKKNKDKNRLIKNDLERLGYKNAFVTIVTLDYHINLLLQKALQKKRKIDYKKLKELYLDVILDNVEGHDKSLSKILGYRPVHVLLLHENDINALYLKDMVRLLQEKGWEVVAPEEAFDDLQVANHAQDTYYDYESKIKFCNKVFWSEVVE